MEQQGNTELKGVERARALCPLLFNDDAGHGVLDLRGGSADLLQGDGTVGLLFARDDRFVVDKVLDS